MTLAIVRYSEEVPKTGRFLLQVREERVSSLSPEDGNRSNAQNALLSENRILNKAQKKYEF
jgi:hypothetical protein